MDCPEWQSDREGSFSANTMRTWFQRTMVLGMLGTVKAGDTCRSGDCDVQVHLKSNPLKVTPQDSTMWLWVMSFVMLLCVIMGGMCGWRLHGWWGGLGAPKKEKAIRAPKKVVRTMMVQAQTRYAFDRVEPRFVPLGELEHGAWLG